MQNAKQRYKRILLTTAGEAGPTFVPETLSKKLWESRMILFVRWVLLQTIVWQIKMPGKQDELLGAERRQCDKNGRIDWILARLLPFLGSV